MIVSQNIHPVKNLYSLGGELLKIIDESNEAIDLFLLYDQIKIISNIGFSSYLYALDWLFILNLINVNEKGAIKKCF